MLIAAWGEPARPLVGAIEGAGLEAVVLLDELSEDHLHIEEAAWAAPVVGLRAGPIPRIVSPAEAQRIVEAAMDAGADAILPAPGRYASSVTLAHQAVMSGLAWCGARAETLDRISEPSPEAASPAGTTRFVVVLLGDGEGGALPLGVQRRVRALAGSPDLAGWTELDPTIPAPLLEIARRHVRALRAWGMVGVHLDASAAGAWLRELEPGLVGGWRLHDRGLGVSLPLALAQLAGGETLGWEEADLGIRRVHLQAAVVATQSGSLEAFDPGPAGASTLPEGAVINPQIDPILLRVIVSGDDREAALQSLGEALAAVTVVGVPTNLDALQRAVERERQECA